MNLSRRFIVLIAALLVACGIVTWTGLAGLGTLDHRLSSVVQGDVQRLLHVTSVRRNFRNMVVLERDHILEHDPAKMRETSAKIVTARSDFQKEFDAYAALSFPDELPELQRLHGAFERWVALDDEVLRLSSAGQPDDAFQLAGRHAADPVQWEPLISKLIARNEARLRAESDAALAGSARSQRVLIGVGLASMLVALVVGGLVFRGIKRMVDEVLTLNSNLEELVAVRTRALAEREASIRLILDSTGDGLATITHAGRFGDVSSKRMAAWFGESCAPGASAAECLAGANPAKAPFIEMAFEQVVSDTMPFEASVDLLPARCDVGERTYEFQYRGIERDGALDEVLLIASDVTERIAAERAQASAREVQSLVGHLLQDRTGFRTFVKDAMAHLDVIDTAPPSPALQQALHTLKGNAYVYGIASVGDVCHQLENTLADGGDVEDADRRAVRAAFEASMKRVEAVVGHGALDGVLVTSAQLQSLVDLLDARHDHAEIKRTVESWHQDSARAALKRLAAQTERVAKTLGKQVSVEVAGGDVELPPGAYDAFWSTLIHVVRNAAYHGIEPEEERVLAGKPEAGFVWLGAKVRDDGRFEVVVRDDGRGIDVERLRQKAITLGLDADQIDPLQLVFADGVSTAAAVDETAGRGVGMSAVASETKKLEGRVHVATEAGQGTAFRFSFPPVTGRRSSPSSRA